MLDNDYIKRLDSTVSNLITGIVSRGELNGYYQRAKNWLNEAILLPNEVDEEWQTTVKKTRDQAQEISGLYSKIKELLHDAQSMVNEKAKSRLVEGYREEVSFHERHAKRYRWAFFILIGLPIFSLLVLFFLSFLGYVSIHKFEFIFILVRFLMPMVLI